MVASARKETEASERRNEQLKQQLHDTELLLASHQEQLQDLKTVMEKLSSERGEEEANTYISTVPSTPGAGVHDKMSRMLDSVTTIPSTPSEDVAPDHPLRFSHLIRPILRTDLDTYDDFKTVLTASKATPQSRTASGSFTGISLATLTGGQAHPLNHTSSPSAQSVSTIASSSPSKDPFPQLKDTKLYKRALAEDIEPTLRLDIAPGLSWLARRTVLNAISNQTLVIEPLPPPKSKFYGPIFACALCGEHRKSEQYKRKHQFRTSDAEDAQRYPLCEFCLGRVRATCDYIGFLRLVRDGLWRAETDEDIRGAWEEAVRLRERMFWARIGGGVVPVQQHKPEPKSPKSLHVRRQDSIDSVALKAVGEDPFLGEKRTSLAAEPNGLDIHAEERIAEEASEQLREDIRRSMEVKPSTEESNDAPTTNGEHERIMNDTESIATLEPAKETAPATETEPAKETEPVMETKPVEQEPSTQPEQQPAELPLKPETKEPSQPASGAETPEPASVFATPKEEKKDLEFAST